MGMPKADGYLWLWLFGASCRLDRQEPKIFAPHGFRIGGISSGRPPLGCLAPLAAAQRHTLETFSKRRTVFEHLLRKFLARLV
jgi:hypothetical protein